LAKVLTYSLELVDRADIHILILGHRYGYIPDDSRNPERLSIVELEYNEAIRLGKTVLAFILDDKQPVSPSNMETDKESSKRLREFKDRIMRLHVVSFFTSPDDLRGQVIQALATQGGDASNQAVAATQQAAEYSQKVQAEINSQSSVTEEELESEAWFERAQQALQAQNYSEAIQSLTELIGLQPERTEAYINRGKAYSALGQYQQAIGDFDHAIRLQPNDARAYFERGTIYKHMDKYDSAIADYNRALELSNQYGGRLEQSRNLFELGQVYHLIGQNEQASQYLEQSLAMFREIGDRLGEANALRQLGTIWGDWGEKRKALEYYEQALPLMRATGEQINEAITLNGIGSAYRSLGEARKALDYYEQALPLMRAKGERGGEATTLNKIGGLYDDLGEKRKALEYYEQALPLMRTAGERGGEATTLTNIGGVWNTLGNRRKALDYYEQALPIYRAVGDKNGEATTLVEMSQINSELNESASARQYLESAISSYRELGRTEIADELGKDLKRLDQVSDESVSRFERRIYLSSRWSPGHTANWENEYISIHGSRDEPLMLLQGHTDQVNGLLEASDGSLISWSLDRTLRRWNRNGELLAVLEGHTASVNGVLEMPDKRLLSWSTDKTLRIWSESGEALAVLSGHTAAVTNAEVLEDGRIKSTDSNGAELIWSSDGRLEEDNEAIPYIRVFLACAADVRTECKIAADVIDNFPNRSAYQDQVAFRVVSWDSAEGDSDITPQEAINRGLPKPSECDIVVAIFWSRMGTPIIVDGVEYLSGTHWELMDALGSPRPETIIFRRMEQPRIDVSKPQATSRIEQYRQVEEFFKSEVFYNEDGKILRGINTYKSVDDFKRDFEIFFEEIVVLILEKMNNQK
jgi:tetratricopeptide (TPR) repeat protein